MKNRVINYKWRNRIEEITRKDYRIGDDVLLIDDANAIRAGRVIGEYPFKVDMSMAIIYDKGETTFKIDMRTYQVKAPAVIVIMHGQTCELISYSADLQGRVIAMSSSFADSLFVGAEGGYAHKLYSSMISNPLIIFDKDQDVFSRYYQQLKDLIQSPNSEFKIDAVRHLTLAMFYGYSHMKHDLNSHTRGTSRQDDIYAAFLSAVGDNYKKQREVGFYADKLCISAKHLSQVVKGLSGRNASDVIEDYVITEIKALLLSTNMTIQQISDYLNFPSQSVFGKYFKRLTGKSPKEYRADY
ncbi:MAG: helix-turn-helix domain-containing protein [Alistipes sp.]|nr:helix-turn-helix domain-containing protein [Alistipes sp.]